MRSALPLCLLGLLFIPFTGAAPPSGLDPIKWGPSAAEAPAPVQPEPPTGPWRLESVEPARGTREAGQVVLVVEATLYEELSQELSAYAETMRFDGWTVGIDSVSGGAPPDLRAHLTQRYQEGIDGAFLIGDLPVALCRLPVDFGFDVFPVDLYYMDLDGLWPDPDQDGVFDDHTGSVQAEIWVGRLRASPLNFTSQTEAELTEAYLAKATHYRETSPLPAQPALVFTDISFASDSHQGLEAVRRLHPDCDRITRGTGPEYADELVAGRPWIALYSHGSAYSHALPGGSFTYDQLPGLSPQTPFYSIYSCSNSRYTSTDYMGGWYVCSPGRSLALTGSTKTGSLYFLSDLIGPLETGVSLGEAYRNWSTLHHSQNPPWFYGVTLLGDPTLTALRQPLVESVELVELTGDGDGTAEAGEELELWITVRNRSGNQYEAVQATLLSHDPLVEVLPGGPLVFGDLGPGEGALAGPLTIRLDPAIPDGTEPDLELSITSLWDFWLRPLRLAVAAPDLRAGQPWIDEREDGWLSPGEEAPIWIPVDNVGAGDLQEMTLMVESGSEHLVLTGSVARPVELAPGERIWLGPVQASLAPACPVGEVLPLLVFDPEDRLPTGTTILAGGGVAIDPALGWCGSGHGPATAHSFDQWRRDPPDLHCGRPGEDEYNSGMDAALELPTVLVGSEAWLEWEHSMVAEGAGPSCYDGGRVEVDIGAGFEPLTPEVPYPAFFEVGCAAEPGSPCWGAVTAWTSERCRLPTTSEPVRLRFRFTSDGGATGTGWRLRNLRLTGSLTIPTPGPTSTPSPTPSPTATPTATPTSPFTATPTPSPTGPPALDLALSTTWITPGERFLLQLDLKNPGPPYPVELFVLLDEHGSYWSWPGWEPGVAGQSTTLAEGLDLTETLLDFTWPDWAGTDTDLAFWGALIDPAGGALLDLEELRWGYGG